MQVIPQLCTLPIEEWVIPGTVLQEYTYTKEQLRSKARDNHQLP